MRGYHGEYKLPADWAHFHNWKNAVTSSPSKLLHYIVRQRPAIRYLQTRGRLHRMVIPVAIRDHVPAEVSIRRYTEFKK